MIHHSGSSSIATHPFLFSFFFSCYFGIWTPDMTVKGCGSSHCIFLTWARAFCSICLGTFRKGGISPDGSRCLWGLKSRCNRNRTIILLSRLIGGVMSGTSKRGALFFYGKSILIVGAVLEHKHCEKQLWLKPPTWGHWIIHQAGYIPSSCADVNAEGLRGKRMHAPAKERRVVRAPRICLYGSVSLYQRAGGEKRDF